MTRIYLDRFEAEAKARGFDFDLAKVQVAYVDAITVNNVTYWAMDIAISAVPVSDE